MRNVSSSFPYPSGSNGSSLVQDWSCPTLSPLQQPGGGLGSPKELAQGLAGDTAPARILMGPGELTWMQQLLCPGLMRIR